MGESVRFSIDGVEVAGENGETIMTAARKAGIYIPYLCAHPDLLSESTVGSRAVIFRGHDEIFGKEGKEFSGCQLCLVEIEGTEGMHRACATRPEDGMTVRTDTPELQELRRDNLTKLLVNHPHACLVCPQREGCSLSHCSSNVPEAERCCLKFFKCEIRKLGDYIGIRENIPSYVIRSLPVITEEPLFTRDYNLCINCLRCVRICEDAVGVGALSYTVNDGAVIVGTNAPTLKESGCKFCGACVEVCPTGALTYKDAKTTPKRTHKLRISPPIFPPEKWLKLESKTIASVPEIEGVYRLLDEAKNTIYIAGTMNLRRELEEQLKSNGKAQFFTFEPDPMYTRRESELLQQFLQTHGRLPEQNIAIDDLL